MGGVGGEGLSSRSGATDFEDDARLHIITFSQMPQMGFQKGWHKALSWGSGPIECAKTGEFLHEESFILA